MSIQTMEDRVAAVMADTSADKYGKKNHTATALAKLATTIETPPPPPAEGDHSRMQLIAGDMKQLTVREAFQLAQSQIQVENPDLKDIELRAAIKERVFSNDDWCHQVPGAP